MTADIDAIRERHASDYQEDRIHWSYEDVTTMLAEVDRLTAERDQARRIAEDWRDEIAEGYEPLNKSLNPFSWEVES